MIVHPDKYNSLISKNLNLDVIECLDVYDHLGGFDSQFNNGILNSLQEQNFKKPINIQYTFVDEIINKYSSLDLRFSFNMEYEMIFRHFHNYNVHPLLKIKNLLCSFNGSPHVSRQLLTSILEHFGIFNSKYCTKNFSNPCEQVIEQLNNLNLSSDEVKLYRKFFTSNETFCNNSYTFNYERFKHSNNIYNLENSITESFVHLVSETMSTSYYPFITEKFLYSVVTRGLFIAYGQPLWHQHLESFYGFKPYTNVFDYSFDKEINPVKRLVKLMEMISKFKTLTNDELCDLYQLENETIEYNYDHYFSKQYQTHVNKTQ